MTTPSTHKKKGLPPKGTAARVPTTVRLDPAVRAWLKAHGEGQRNDVLNALCFAAMRDETITAPALLDEADAVLMSEASDATL